MFSDTTLTFNGSALTPQSFQIPINNDSAVGSKVIVLQLLNATPVSCISDSCSATVDPSAEIATITIVDQPPSAISIVSGNNQTGVINAPLARPLVVSVTQGGAPVSGVIVTWQIVSGSGALSATSTPTGSNGQAQTTLTLGSTPGAVAVRASVGDSSVTYNVNDAAQTAIAGLKLFSVMGNLAVTTTTVQMTNIGLRLAALRRGAGGVSLSGLSLNFDGLSVPLDAVTSFVPPIGKGGGASADPSRLFGSLGVFLNGQGSFGDQRATSREPGFDFHTAGVTLGSDYRLTSNLVLGAAFGYLNTKAEVDAGASHVTTNGYSLSAYGTYFIADKVYVDGIATYGWNKYDTTRNITFSDSSETAKGNTDGNQFALSVGGGYNFNFGPLTAGPSLRVNYIRVHIDDFRETGADIFNLNVDSQKVESLATALGGQVSYAVSMPWGVLLPLARFEWEHEYKGGTRLITGSLVADPVHTSFAVPTNNPDRNYFNLGAGVTATLKGGASAFFYYETVLGRDNVTNHSFNAGVRFQFE